jgi:hypothetical protein
MLAFERQMKNLKICFNFTVSIHGTFIISFHVLDLFEFNNLKSIFMCMKEVKLFFVPNSQRR